ncbi:MFS transporter [bacterium]|nr:MFS transporter [bacterium]
MERAGLVFRAFSSRNYRLYFIGLSVSVIGSWMQSTAMSWLVYRLTGSAMLLGVIAFLAQVPSLVLTPLAGVLLDRIEKRRVIMWTQVLAMAQAAVLATLVLTGVIATWHLVVLSLALGMVHAIDAPARQSFVVHLVGRKDLLGNAIALNSTMFNAARLVGPFVAGILVASVGEGICFLINAVSYVAAITSLGMMPAGLGKPTGPRKHFLHELHEGFAAAFSFMPLRTLIMHVAFISLVGMSYNVLAPIFAREVLHGDARTFGCLTAGVGCGALCAALFLASRRTAVGLSSVVAVATGLLGVSLVVFSQSRVFALSLGAMVVAGFGALATLASCNTLVQTIVDDRKRGRVMGIYMMFFLGVAPFGSLLMGWLAQTIGAPTTQMLSGLACIAGALAFSTRLPEMRRLKRPLYIEMGLLQSTNGR